MLQPEVMSDPAKAAAAADALADRLNAMTPDLERGWICTAIGDGTLTARRSLRGYTETYVLDGQLLRSAEARRLNEMAAELHATYQRPAALRRKDETHRSEEPHI